MTAKVIELPTARPERTRIGHAIRTGESAYRQLGNLHAEGRLNASTMIIDASKAMFQKEFIVAVQESGGEVILDTKCAELSEIGRCNGYAKGAPWAKVDEQRPLVQSDYRPGANIDLYNSIARFAVELNVDAVFAPTHFIREGAKDDWWPIDCTTITLLRHALDSADGKHIGIDYPLIVKHTILNNEVYRRQLVAGLAELPFDNLFVRLSGFGSGAGPLTMKNTFAALNDLHMLGKPIVLDHVGGLVGIGALAFGRVSGIAHGIGERERFDASDWNKKPKQRDPSAPIGRATYIPVPGFDRGFLSRDIELIASTPKGRRLVSCGDRICCPHGFSSMQSNLRAHIASQKLKAVDDLAAVPDRHRIKHFIDSDMRNAERKARDLAQLSTGDEKLDKKLADGRKRIDSLARTFENLAEQPRGDALPPIIRGRNRMSSTGLRLI